MSRGTRGVVTLLGFAVYTGALVMQCEMQGWERIVVAMIGGAGLAACGIVRWGMPSPGE
jgi:hypothetical protein